MNAGRLAAVIGRPVRHSLSPVMHNAAFEAAGLDWAFTRFELAEGGVPAAIDAMPALGIGGYAVTMPHKPAAFHAVDEVDPDVRRLRSVNTIVLHDDGTTSGTSTDGRGFVDWVRASGTETEGLRVAVVGAGAAARSIVHALDAYGRAGRIAVINRTASAAVEAAELSEIAAVGTEADISGAELVVNATSVGMGTDDSPIAVGLLTSDHVVADIVYHPLETALLRAARDAGARVVDGLGMLVYQAVLQHELWTGRRPDPSLMRAAAERALSRGA